VGANPRLTDIGMKCVESNLGIATTDGDNVRLRYDGDILTLAFSDWHGHQCHLVFGGVLAFRWQEFDEVGIRDDTSYKVVGSEWLDRQAQLCGVNVCNYAHYKRCFNARGTLDFLARSVDRDVR
jgi:hypothetical protein